MVNLDPGTSKYTVDGVGSFDSRQQAMAWEHAQGAQGGGRSGGGGIEDGILGAVWTIFLLLGKLVGFLIGLVVGLLLKLGMVGKVCMTGLVGLLGFIVSYILFDSFIPSNFVVSILAIAGTAATGFWFWVWHYPIVKIIPLFHFTYLTARTFSIAFYGSIIIWIALALVTKMNEGTAMGVGIGIAFLLSVIYWLWKTFEFKVFLEETEE